ncbi:hypothetical protein [Acinetobacter sp. NIPH 2699]|nr:hypothetical protein [Acinetobacter sp. NIPH 2699]
MDKSELSQWFDTAFKFEQTPEPDFINIDEDELDYTEYYSPK